MIFLRACGNCGSCEWRIYGVTVDQDTLHPVQCRCSGCGLIFANPRATLEELDTFYESYYAARFPHYLLTEREFDDRVREVRGHLLDVVGERRGKFLEIGFGSGAILRAAVSMGLDAYGLELSQQAVDVARTQRGLPNTWCSSLENRAFDPAQFDVIYAWHVIEHVADLDAFVTEMHRVLKPGGLLFIGTECGTHTVATTLFRAWSRLRGTVPRTITATEHTFVFSPHSLRNILERRGFEVQRLLSYDEVRDRAVGLHAGSQWRTFAYRGLWSFSHAVDRMLRRGPYLKCFATKRP